MKYVLHNLAKDPSFENIDMWTPAGTGASAVADTSIKKYGNQSIKLTGTGTEVYVSCTQTSTMVQGHRYYARIEGYQDTKAGNTLDIYWPSAEPMFNTWTIGNAGNWNLYSYINTRDSWNGEQSIRVDYNNGSSTEPIYFDGLIMIDLTADFPNGDYPEIAELDKIPFFEGTYVYDDGKINFDNLVTNGSFENDLTNWEISGTIISTTLDRCIGITSACFSNETTSTSNILSQNLTDLLSNHKYYLKANFKSDKTLQDDTTLNFKLSESETDIIDINVINYIKNNEWVAISEIVENATSASTYVIKVEYGKSANETSNIYIDGLELIDLTETFGSGNEPTKEWCDHNLPKYFEKRFILEKVPVFGVDSHTLVMAHYTSDLSDSSDNKSVEYTAANTPQLSLEQSKFGLKSFDARAYNVPAYNTGRTFLNGDWTLDWWEYWTNNANTNRYMCLGTSTEAYNLILHIISGTNVLGIYAGNNGGWGLLNAWNTGLTKVLNEWNHKALVHKDGVIYCYQNGILKNSTALPNFSVGVTEESLFVNGFSANQYFGGFLSEVRLSNIARWNDNFIPPLNPYREMPAPYNISIPNSVFDKDSVVLQFSKLENVETYEIQRMIYGGEWTTVYTTIPSDTEFSDNVKKSWKKFQYRIRGVTSDGQGGAWGYSNICRVNSRLDKISIGGQISPIDSSIV